MTGDVGARWTIHGSVQGVGFRWFTARAAEALSVRGWVTNLPDGSVEVVAWGQPKQIAELEKTIGRGPRGANVESVEKSDTPHDASECKSFDIK